MENSNECCTLLSLMDSFNLTQVVNSPKRLCLDLINESWYEMYTCNNFNDMFICFHNTLKFYIDKHFPIKKTVIKEDKLWVTNDIRQSSQNLKDLFTLANSNNDLKPLYTYMKSKHQKLISETKKQYFQNKIVRASNPGKANY